MQRYHLSLQCNKHQRDYVYEVSTFYLTASCYLLAMHMDLPSLISNEGATIHELNDRLPDYSPDAIQQLIEFLSLYQFFSIRKNKIFLTCYSAVANEFKDDYQLNTDEWNDSYDILYYLEAHPSIIKNFSTQLLIKIENHCITYEATGPEEILNEIFGGHLISRSLRYLTTSGMADKIYIHKTISIHDLRISTVTDCRITDFSLECLCKLLSRYQIINYNSLTKIISSGEYLSYLTTAKEDSIAKAMHMISLPWWSAVAQLQYSFLKEAKSAFEIANNKTFYEEYISTNNRLFNEGLASFSLLEDQDVCDALSEELKSFETIVDIGGGDAALLKKLHRLFPNKNYVLFEKIPADCLDIEAAENALADKIKQTYDLSFELKVILGDFTLPFADSRMPKCKNAAYLMKCVLHNIAEKKDIINVLKLVYQALDTHSTFFLAERIAPENLSRPHINVQGNILMRTLFKAEPRNVEFYKNVLVEANFTLEQDNALMANHYLIFRNHVLDLTNHESTAYTQQRFIRF